MVAAVIEEDGRFLLVEENTPDGVRLNQPAGHLEPDESLEQAVVRETLEETAHDFIPTELVGMYLMNFKSQDGGADRTYLRFAFTGQLGSFRNLPLDDGILRTVWMSYDEILACRARHRSPLLLQCIEDYLRGQRAPLSLLHMHTAIMENLNG